MTTNNPAPASLDIAEVALAAAERKMDSALMAFRAARAHFLRMSLAKHLVAHGVPATHTFSLMDWGVNEPDHVTDTAMAIEGVYAPNGDDAYEDIDWRSTVFECAATVRRGAVVSHIFNIFATDGDKDAYSVAKVYDWYRQRLSVIFAPSERMSSAPPQPLKE